MSFTEEILSLHFPGKQWVVEKPPAGLSKESYIATSGNFKLFLKYDVNTPALGRLAAIGVTPQVKARGSYKGRDYIIQEYVQGDYPDRKWFSKNIPILVNFVKRYHDDKLLRDILLGHVAKSYKEHINDEIKILDTSLKGTRSEVFGKSKFKDSYILLKKQATKLKPSTLMTVHADPNYKNILLTDKGITMLDWDDVLLSDPIRDIGLLLWWYIPRDKWRDFFNLYGSPMDLDKIFWWVAKRSLSIALWFDKKRDDKETVSFLEDFYSALNKEDNSKYKK